MLLTYLKSIPIFYILSVLIYLYIKYTAPTYKENIMTIKEKYKLAHKKFWEVAKQYDLSKPYNFKPKADTRTMFSPEHSTIVIGCYEVWKDCKSCILIKDCEEGGVFDKIFKECQEYFDEEL